MPPKRKISNAKVLREHGAETQLQPMMQNSLRSILRQRSAEPELSTYRSRSQSNIWNPTQHFNPIEVLPPRLRSPPPPKRKQPKIRTKSAKKSKYDTFDTSSSDSDSEADSDSDESSNESLDSTSTFRSNKNQHLTEPSSVTPYILQSLLPIPSFTIDQDVRFFIEDMTAYFRHNSGLTRQAQVQLIRSAIKGTAREVLLGYNESELSSSKKIFKVLKQEFQKREKYAGNLHKLKQEEGEQVSLFASRIRRYVKGVGIKKHKIDTACLDYLKLGVHSHIQNRLHHIQSFKEARRIAMEIEAERTKTKSKADTVNTTVVSTNPTNNSLMDSKPISEIIHRQLLDLNALVQAQQNHIQQQNQQLLSRSNNTRIDSSVPSPRSTRECFHCHRKGHGYRQCRSADDRDKQVIKEKLAKEWREKSFNKGSTSVNPLNSQTASTSV